MLWMEEVAIKQKKKNKILFAKNSDFLQDLILMIQNSTHRELVLWAFDLAAESVCRLAEKYPEEGRPREALAAAEAWAAGEIKMGFAKRKILDCHAFAKELENQEHIAQCHAIGQACSVVHTPGHAIGYPVYDLTSLVYKLGLVHCTKAVEDRKQAYIDRLLYWKKHAAVYQGKWADFLKE